MGPRRRFLKHVLLLRFLLSIVQAARHQVLPLAACSQQRHRRSKNTGRCCRCFCIVSHSVVLLLLVASLGCGCGPHTYLPDTHFGRQRNMEDRAMQSTMKIVSVDSSKGTRGSFRMCRRADPPPPLEKCALRRRAGRPATRMTGCWPALWRPQRRSRRSSERCHGMCASSLTVVALVSGMLWRRAGIKYHRVPCVWQETRPDTALAISGDSVVWDTSHGELPGGPVLQCQRSFASARSESDEGVVLGTAIVRFLLCGRRTAVAGLQRSPARTLSTQGSVNHYHGQRVACTAADPQCAAVRRQSVRPPCEGDGRQALRVAFERGRVARVGATFSVCSERGRGSCKMPVGASCFTQTGLYRRHSVPKCRSLSVQARPQLACCRHAGIETTAFCEARAIDRYRLGTRRGEFVASTFCDRG